MPKITPDVAMVIMKVSFAPLVCLTKEDDYGNRILMELLTCEGTAIFSFEFSKKQFSDEHRLRQILNGLRRELKAKGHF